jgi:tetratricopeptide (TPR) repeat protein
MPQIPSGFGQIVGSYFLRRTPPEKEGKETAAKPRRRAVVAFGAAVALWVLIALILIALWVFENHHAKIERDRGDFLMVQGKLPEALDSYQKSLATVKHLGFLVNSNSSWQQDLSVCYKKVGNVLMAQGKPPEALDAYQQSLTIRRNLPTRRNPIVASSGIWQ